MAMVEDADLGLKRPATLTLTIVEKVFMMIGEVDIGLRQANLFPIKQVELEDR